MFAGEFNGVFWVSDVEVVFCCSFCLVDEFNIGSVSGVSIPAEDSDE